MKRYGYDDLIAIQQACVSASADDPRDVLRWLDGVGIDVDAFEKFTQMNARASATAAKMAMEAGFLPEHFFAALFSAAFEVGVRFEQSRELEI